MSKYKIGDVVEILPMVEGSCGEDYHLYYSPDMERYVGQHVTIIAVYDEEPQPTVRFYEEPYSYRVSGLDDPYWAWTSAMLKPVSKISISIF